MNAEILAKLTKLERKATPGPWEADQHDQHADTVYVAVHGPDGKSLFDTCNSESMLIHNDSDEDGPHYWDETGKANLEFVAMLRNHAASLFEIARLGMIEIESQRDLIADLAKKNEELRKIAAHVPGLVYIKAKESAGFGVKIVAKEGQ